MRARFIVGVTVWLAGLGAIAGAARAQTHRPPRPAPPVRDLVLCATRLENLYSTGLDGRRDDEDLATAVELLDALYQNERDRFLDRIESELGPLAWSAFVPGESNAAQQRFEQAREEGCVRQALVRGRDHADAAVQSRSRELLDRYDAAVALPASYFMPAAGDPVDPAREADASALGLELPPSELVVPGAHFTGRVVLDLGEGRVPADVLADGLLAQMGAQTARVGREGLFVMRAPREPGTYAVEIRHQHRPLMVPVEGRLTIPRQGGAGEAGVEGASADDLPPRPIVDCAGFDRFLEAATGGDAGAAPPAECSIVASRVILPEQRLIVLGRVGDSSGLAMRAFVGPWEAPLLAKTPIAAVFDVSGVPAGLQPVTLYDAGKLMAVAAAYRVVVSAASDRSQLGRGDVATFDVHVAGLPRPPSAPEAERATSRVDAGALAFLDYANNSPEVGRFRDQGDRFTVAIAARDLATEPAPLRSDDQRSLLERIEQLVAGRPALRRARLGEAAAAPDAEVVPPPATDTAAVVAPASAGATGGFDDVQRYRGTGDGDFHVRVSVRVRDDLARLEPAIVPAVEPEAINAESPPRPTAPPNTIGAPLAETGTDDRGVFAEIDGQKLYFWTGHVQSEVETAEKAAPHLFQAACSGVCQCSIQSWDHAGEVGQQVAALDRTRPEWRTVTASVELCSCDEARAQCYGALSLECRTRCKRFFESALTDHVSGFATEASVGACTDRGACDQ